MDPSADTICTLRVRVTENEADDENQAEEHEPISCLILKSNLESCSGSEDLSVLMDACCGGLEQLWSDEVPCYG